MTRNTIGRTGTAALLALLVSAAALAMTAPPARAMQILEATDHAELAAEISARDVSRIALGGDRIKRVIRAPGGFGVEHDPESGDLYLRPLAPAGAPPTAYRPVTLFIGTERGFTYRLTLTPADRDSAQILIRNTDAAAAAIAGRGAGASDPRVAALVRLVRAVARREVLPGYEIVPGGGASMGVLSAIETWRGPRFAAHVVEAGTDPSAGSDPSAGTGPNAGTGPGTGTDARDVAALAGTMFGGEGRARVAAVWLAPRGTGPSGGRLAVLVTEAASRAAAAGELR